MTKLAAIVLLALAGCAIDPECQQVARQVAAAQPASTLTTCSAVGGQLRCKSTADTSLANIAAAGAYSACVRSK